ncbi:NADH-quinone oxidoreductase subunit M [Phycicoccus sp. 3266]|uniref:complex I subunit 4 family protein n=1 Tax=Phycicoccus sp. 3266 TaxID=2817751 RepID=UPI0028569B1D|nr:NADH-quinone oxidoreductase subunit M [Phycicoccus sp. 3266]MDR6863824.1 NADH-quinone oxidoreductase subunit M [Phycicoccus sp. 3266]
MVILVSLVVPAAVAVWLLTAGRRLGHRAANAVATAASVVTLGAVLWAVIVRPTVDRAWVPSLGLRWQLAVDGISAPLLLMTALLGVGVVLHTLDRPPTGGTTGAFHACLLLVEFGALATFYARDAVLFFVAFELVLVPMWVLITRYGDPHDARARADAGGRFVLYTAFGSTLMLVGILALVAKAGTADLDVLAQGGRTGIPVGTQTVVAALLVAGLAVKVPVFPLHTWLPSAHTTAPTAGSVLLAAVLLKMGTYGLVRLPLASVPEGFSRVAPVLAVLGAVGILWGGLACLVERDLKRLIAYSSVVHMGFVVLGLASGTRTGLQAALFANIAHGVISALLFVVVGGLKERWGDADLRTARAAVREVAPRLGFALVLGLAASLGLPGLAGFWGEFLSVYAAWSPADDRPTGLFRGLAVVAAFGTVLAAAYALRVARTVWAGERREPFIEDSRDSEWDVIAVLALATVLLGVLPGPLLALTSPAVATLVGAAR